MTVQYTPDFKKQYKKLQKKFRARFDERLNLFLEHPTHPLLRVHPLKGSFAGYWSMNITGDIRALYRMDGNDSIIFALIGTHSRLYG
ncbi:type II toxin-antitoxin system mRNA interferase toxin, RelE/StbE family [Candidatus Uhrbacteria bacterium]|nr:type II toxin-antitoxin system mRNA interferase toxin, RelE/StbE family [Candidatus Uhrbacteria bacterium]